MLLTFDFLVRLSTYPIPSESRPEFLHRSRIQHVLLCQPGAAGNLDAPFHRLKPALAVRVGADHDLHAAVARGFRVDIAQIQTIDLRVDFERDPGCGRSSMSLSTSTL